MSMMDPANATANFGNVVSTFRLLVLAEPATAKRLTLALAPFGYSLEIESSVADAMNSIQSAPPEVAIASGSLADNAGFNLLRRLRTQRSTEDLPVLFVTAPDAPDQELRAFQMGAEEVVGADTSDGTLRARLRVLLRFTSIRRRLINEKRRLEIRVTDRTRELLEITIATVAALEKAAEMTDQETGQHMTRVAEYSSLLATEMGMDHEFIEKIRLYAPLHDVGKVGIRHDILKKEGVLTRQEFDEMKLHTRYGYELLTAARADPVASNIALSHHERIDGSGYPNALKGDAIPLEARLVAVADVFDALTTRRHYKEALHPDDAFTSIGDELASRFDQSVIKAFLSRRKDITDVFLRCQ
jgi:putative nucleotidyltransferase with HDIG domain